MSDYRRIRVSTNFSKLRPSDTLHWHVEARTRLTNELAQPHEGPTVVVTHHAPTLRGCRPDDATTPFLGAYASDLESLMGPNVDAWLFGHTHFAFDERINGTRVESNPRGSPASGWRASDPSSRSNSSVEDRLLPSFGLSVGALPIRWLALSHQFEVRVRAPA